MPAALDKGRVDAIWAPEPFLTVCARPGRAERRGAARRRSARTSRMGPTRTTEKQIAQDDGRRRRRSRARSTSRSEYATAHPDEARATIPTFTQIPPEVAAKIRLPLWPTTDRHGEARDAGRLHGQVQADREAAAARRLDLGGRELTVLAPLAAVAVAARALGARGAAAGSSPSEHSARLGGALELVFQLAEGAFWSAVGNDAAGLGARARDRDRARRPARAADRARAAGPTGRSASRSSSCARSRRSH